MFLRSLQPPPVIRYKSTQGKEMIDTVSTVIKWCSPGLTTYHDCNVTVICRLFQVQLNDRFYKRGLQKLIESIKQVDSDHPSFTIGRRGDIFRQKTLTADWGMCGVALTESTRATHIILIKISGWGLIWP